MLLTGGDYMCPRLWSGGNVGRGGSSDRGRLATVIKTNQREVHWPCLLLSHYHSRVSLPLTLFQPYSTGPEPKPILQGNQRTWRVWLDTNQYQRDMEAIVQGSEVCACCCVSLCRAQNRGTEVGQPFIKTRALLHTIIGFPIGNVQ